MHKDNNMCNHTIQLFWYCYNIILENELKKNKMMIFIIILLLHEDVSLLIVVLLAGKSSH